MSRLPVSKKQAGFTLVELAIVMIIIGLLIAGVLKGQQLIGNAKVTSTVAQIKGIDGATSTFRDMYAALPGDVTTPTTRIPNCNAAPCSTAANAGNGDGNVGAVTTFNAAPATEQLVFFAQLALADLLTGVNPVANTLTWGGDFPAAKINGGFHVGTAAGNAQLNSSTAIAAGAVRGGLYLALHNTPAGAVAAGGTLSTNEAARIDVKVDDGIPSSGSVFPAGAVGAAGCSNGNLYNESLQGSLCNLYIRIQG